MNEIRVRANLLFLGFLCALGASFVVISGLYLWQAGLQALVYVLGAVWIVANLPFLAVAAVTIGEVVHFIGTGTTVYFPAMIRVGHQLEQQRMLAGREPRQVSSLRRALNRFGFYTNPLNPLLLALTIYLGSRPVDERGVGDLVKKLADRSQRYRLVGGVGISWKDSTGGHVRPA